LCDLVRDAVLALVPSQIVRYLSRNRFKDTFKLEKAKTASPDDHALFITSQVTQLKADLLVNVYYDEDADLSVLRNETVAIIGYGNQGRPHALNIRDSGVNVIVGNVKDSYYDQALSDGFKTHPIGEAARQANIIYIMLPDEIQQEVYETEIKQYLSKGKMLVFASGYSVHFGLVVPPKDVDVVDMFPLGLGPYLREHFIKGEPINAYLAIGQDATGKAKQRALALCKAVGTTRGGVLETSFANEIEINLFLEQTVWPAIYRIFTLAFETMVEAGYPPELVSMELYLSKEPSQMFALAANLGLFEQLKLHSKTSQYGTLSRARRIIKDDMKGIMREHLREIQTSAFTREWTLEQAAGYPVFNKLREESLKHPMNEIERRVMRELRL